MKRIFLLLEILALFSFCAFSEAAKGRGAQTLLPASHWIYDSLQIIEQDSAIVQFSDQSPLSIAQVRAMLSEIDYDALSDGAKSHYDRIIAFFSENRLTAQVSIMQVRIDPALNLEGYYKSNKNVLWTYDRFEKKHFLEMPVTIGVGDYLALSADVFAGINKTTMDAWDNYFNIPYNDRNFDVNFPHEAYGSAGYEWTDTVGINFRISNMPQSFGRAQFGSVLQSEYLTDATAAVLTVYSPIVQYSGGLTMYNYNRYLYSHKVDMRFGKKVQFSLMEASLPYGNMDLRYFNPMMILHNYAGWFDYQAEGTDVGSFFGAKINVAPIKHLRVYALWAMSQLQLGNELSDDEEDKDNYVPNAMGAQLGLESFIPFKRGHLHFDLEGSWAQPYLYINSSPNWSFARNSAESNSGSEDIYEWLGTKYGPDSVGGMLVAAYEEEKWSVGFKYMFLARGELSDPDIFKRIGWGIHSNQNVDLADWVYPYHLNSSGDEEFSSKYKNGRSKVAPSGRAEFVNLISLRGSYNLTEWLTFVMQPSLVFIANAGHEAGESAVSFEIAFSTRIKFSKLPNRKNNSKITVEENQNEE